MAEQLIEQVCQDLLAPAELSTNDLQTVLGGMLGKHIDWADLYFQNTRAESWSIEDGMIKSGSHSIERGVGARAISGERTGYAYADDIILPALQQASVAARSIVQQGQTGLVKAQATTAVTPLYASQDPIASLPTSDKLQLLRELDATARQLDPRVAQVNASLVGVYEQVLIIDSAGLLHADIRPLVRVNVSVIVEENGRREDGYAGGGGRGDYRLLLDHDAAIGYAKEAVRQALLNLEAVPAPAGVMPVVLGPGWPGVLLHEAVGHGLEGDFNRKGSSAFSGRIGEQVASPLCTVVDNGAMPGRRGSLTIDDEGTPSQCTVLIENGVLKNYMQDRLNAQLMGMAPTGNGRREAYNCMPMPRMTNTYMLAGNDAPEDIIRSVKKGIYAVNFSGGQVDITSGKFVFAASEAYLIEDGKVTAPIKGATLIGSGPEVMNRISMVGNDLALDSGIGICGKDGQSVPVGVGQPTLKVDEITVGGTV